MTATVTATINDQLVPGAEVEDSIELQKEVEDGERESQTFLLRSFHLELVLLEHQLVSILHFCQESETTRSSAKLYILYSQFKSYLG